MTRNFHDPKDYIWQGEEPGKVLVCIDGDGRQLFAVWNESMREVALNAYFKGKADGDKIGYARFRREVRELFDLPEER